MKCLICGFERPLQRHHIWSGHGTRNISEKYNLIVDLCIDCHRKAHEAKEYYQIAILKEYEMISTYHAIKRIMRKAEKQWDEKEKLYMEE